MRGWSASRKRIHRTCLDLLKITIVKAVRYPGEELGRVVDPLSHEVLIVTVKNKLEEGHRGL